LRWTISQDGKLRLGLANDSDGPEANWIVGISPQILTTNRLGEWQMLATTYDGKKMFHYLDGKLVWSGPVAGPPVSSFDWVELGNWMATRENPAFAWAKGRAKSFFERHFEGSIDEVAVLSRAMTNEDIERLYEQGRPIKPSLAPGFAAR
jgi:hypothetical protein